MRIGYPFFFVPVAVALSRKTQILASCGTVKKFQELAAVDRIGRLLNDRYSEVNF
jgi:hypothetical protein